MKHNFLDDDWLKKQLTEEHLNDDNFSHSTMQKIDEQRQTTPWYIHVFSGAIICSLSYLVINLLLSLFTDTPIEKTPLIDIQVSNLFNGIEVNLISVVVIVLAFALIWSIEELDLL